MARKRFRDSEIWNDKWYRTLSPDFKHAWNYVCDVCDPAGVYERDDDLANFLIGCDVDWDGFLDATHGRVRTLESGKWLIVNFIEFQYGSLSGNCNAHNPVFASIRKNGLDTIIDGLVTDSGSHQCTPVDKDKDKGKDKEKDKDKGGRFSYPLEFEEFWLAYPTNAQGRKRGKKTTYEIWKKVPSTDHHELLQAARNYSRDGGEFIRDPERFLKSDWWRDWVGEAGEKRAAVKKPTFAQQSGDNMANDIKRFLASDQPRLEHGGG